MRSAPVLLWRKPHRRENIRRVNVATITYGDRVGGVQMHDFAAVMGFYVHSHVREVLTGRFVARDIVAVIIKL